MALLGRLGCGLLGMSVGIDTGADAGARPLLLRVGATVGYGAAGPRGEARAAAVLGCFPAFGPFQNLIPFLISILHLESLCMYTCVA